MKRINVEQGSEEWLRWRKSVITATECAVIMGSSIWETPYQLWQRKCDLIPEKEVNEAMEKGKRLEPIARDLFNNTYFFIEPNVVESTEFEFLGASLDGISKMAGTIVEIKCGGKKLHDMALKDIIPEYYMHQMQHQLLVTRSEMCVYVSYYEGELKTIDVFPDPEFQKIYLPKAKEFWKNLVSGQPPEMTDKDLQDKSTELDWLSDSDLYKSYDSIVKEYEIKKSEVRQRLLEKSFDRPCKGNGLKIIKSFTKGRLDEESMKKDGIDIEKYRKQDVVSWKFLVEK